MHLKVILETEKTLKTLSSGQLYKKKLKNPQKKQKNPKKPRKTHWAKFFFRKTRVFSNPAWWWWCR
jgi:hypothetical protein